MQERRIPPVTTNDEDISKSCWSIVKKNGGRYKSAAQQRTLLRLALNGKDPIWEVFIDAVTETIAAGDRAIVQSSFTTGRNATFALFILDKDGVRIVLKQRRYWRALKGSAPYTKANYRDTAERRREQNAGLRERDEELVTDGPRAVFTRREGGE
jgi:hypothetical protein